MHIRAHHGLLHCASMGGQVMISMIRQTGLLTGNKGMLDTGYVKYWAFCDAKNCRVSTLVSLCFAAAGVPAQYTVYQEE